MLLGIIHCLRTIANRAQPLFFATLYLFYKYITPRSARVDLRDLTSSYYVLDDLQLVEQNHPNALNNKRSNTTSPSTAATAVELESPWETQNFGSGNMARAWGSEQVKNDYEISPEMLDEIETQRAGAEERARIRTILEVRPVRWKNGFWREMWSFVVTRERKVSTAT
jgi:amino acid transporter